MQEVLINTIFARIKTSKIMSNIFENDPKVLKKRVRIATEELDKLDILNLKGRFFDITYGKVYHKQNVRLLNMWAARVSDLEFTQKLEQYVKDVKFAIREGQL